MVFLRESRLKFIYTVANYPDDDVEHTRWTGFGDPASAYVSLKGSATDMTWPQGSGVFTFPEGGGYGNQLITDAYGNDYGIRSWSVTAAPGNISGRLSVASYKTTNSNNAAPDNLTHYDLGPGGWDSGELPVQPTDGSVLWRAPRIRWVPVNLLSLL